MKIEKVTVETVKTQPNGRYDDSADIYTIILKIPIPGGVASYTLPSSKEINASIEKSDALK